MGSSLRLNLAAFVELEPGTKVSVWIQSGNPTGLAAYNPTGNFYCISGKQLMTLIRKSHVGSADITFLLMI